MRDEGTDDDLMFLQAGGDVALAEVFTRYKDRLDRIVRFRLDPRLWRRIDPEDVLQEAFIEVSRRLDDYLREPSVPVFVWLRSMTMQMLVNVHRRHLGARMRNAALDMPLHRANVNGDTSVSIAARLAADMTSPSQAAMREEVNGALREALDNMNPIDREVLALRHFEGLGNNEAAAVLGVRKAAASNRYVRALVRLKAALARVQPYAMEPQEAP